MPTLRLSCLANLINEQIESSLRDTDQGNHALASFLGPKPRGNIAEGVMRYLLDNKLDVKKVSTSAGQVGLSVYVEASQAHGCDKNLLMMLGIHHDYDSANEIFLCEYRTIFAVSFTLLMLRQHRIAMPDPCSSLHSIDLLLSHCLEMNQRRLRGEVSSKAAHEELVQRLVTETASPTDDLKWLDSSYRYIIDVFGSSLASAYLYLIFGPCVTHINSISYQRSSDSKYNRIIMTFHDCKDSIQWKLQSLSSPHFRSFRYAPLFHMIVKQLDAAVDAMTRDFWLVIKDSGYYCSTTLIDQLTPLLRLFFQHGLQCTSSSQIDLSAAFLSSYHLSCYWHGLRGLG
jgi:hypothetical protein